ncbi:MAG TPA: hypothetical protein VK934_03500 [Fimbriimonas sp.]|nr:hypothetical protein [Fimbriimonas sp.]
MKIRWTGITTIALVSVMAGSANAAESGLLGIKLFDNGVTVVSKYGNPDDIQAVNVGGGGGGGGGAMGGRGGGPGGPSMPGGGGKSGAGGAAGADFSFGDWVLRQGGPPRGGPPMGPGGPGGPPMGQGGPPPGIGGPPPGMGGNPGGGIPGGGGGAAENALFTRWVYNRSGSKYGFIIDQKGRVVQIEAIGLTNPKVRTSKGVSFGSTFAEVIKKYKTPDGYDIAGNNVMARYLTRNKVAFRFSRLGEGKPQVVTGIVVAAGKG